MRRQKQSLSLEESINIIKKNTSGVLAVANKDEYPYAVPLSYAYADNKLFFHCALVGHKLDMIYKNNKVSFCIIDQDKIVPEKFTTYYRSVIIFGKVHIVESIDEKRRILQLLADKYSPNYQSESLLEIEKFIQKTCIIKFDIEKITGKKAIELVK